MKASVFYKSECELGEGVMWHDARRSFFWVDIEGKTMYECRWNDKHVTARKMPRRVTLVLKTADNDKLILGVQGGLLHYNFQTGETAWLKEIETDIISNRTNDGGYDPKGRIWIGTMDVKADKPTGALYCLDTNGQLKKWLDKIIVPNGIAWTRDGKTMYFVDTIKRVVNAYDYNLDTGEIAFNRVAVKVPDDLGMPDGMCIDDEETLWIAQWGGFGVYRWDPRSGKLLSKIEVPVPNVSACAFGGDDNKTLLITTARQNLSAEELKKYPDSGSVFIA